MATYTNFSHTVENIAYIAAFAQNRYNYACDQLTMLKIHADVSETLFKMLIKSVSLLEPVRTLKQMVS